MRRNLLIGGGALLLVLAAAGGGAMLALRTPAPRPAAATSSPRPTLPASSPSAAASAAPAVSPSPVSVLASLNCRIAISNGQGGSGGWIQVPGGAFTPDPTSSVKPPGSGFSTWGLTHVARLNRWLPVDRNLIAPDATHFVFFDYQRQAVAVATADKVEYEMHSLPPTTQNQGGWTLLSAETEGVYMTGPYGVEGLYLLDWSDKLHTVTDRGFWQAVGGGNAYGTVSQSVPQGAANVVRRRDLKSGAESDYFTRPGQYSRVIGFGAGDAPVLFSSGREELDVWLGGTAPVNLALHKRDPNSPQDGPGWGPGSAIGDGDKTWFTTNDGLFVYTATAGVEKAGSVFGVLGSVCRPT